MSWFSAHLRPCVMFGKEQTEFVYPLEDYSEIDFDIIGDKQERPKPKPSEQVI